AKGSSAEFATLVPGDVIVSVGGIAITSADQLKALIDKAAKDTTFMMIVKHDNAERWVPLLKH
ncbi:MAG TPA: PDZ domain-containing protein, partial [Myxococcota bacterium]|nr:PDZ domain-containing protein [Myxococcota bacterium]